MHAKKHPEDGADLRRVSIMEVLLGKTVESVSSHN